MTQPKRLPVAGLHRASPSATLDKSSCLYTLFGETDYLEYIQAPAICQMFFLLQPLALMIRPVKSHSICKKWSGSCGGLLPLRQVSEALVRLL